MPELPEVEQVRRTLIERIVGKRIERVQIRRADVIRAYANPRLTKRGHSRAQFDTLLGSLTVATVERHGKQLAILGEAPGNPSVCIHLGMSGSLVHRTADQPKLAPHSHVVWHLTDGEKLVFRDPRRFGGVWTFRTFHELYQSRWAKLGPDALTIQPAALHASLVRTTRPLKAALLDQNLIAGLGNIYVDELLFNCRFHPMTKANTLRVTDVRRLVRIMRTLLNQAIESGGSTLRDYVDGNGQKGDFQFSHLAYGRAGEPCSRCEAKLTNSQVAGRTTVHCPQCQILKDHEEEN